MLQAVVDLYKGSRLAAGDRPGATRFYLTAVNPDPDIPLTPAVGRRAGPRAPQPYGLEESIRRCKDLIDDIYEQSDIAGLAVDTMIHESGTAPLRDPASCTPIR